MRSWFISVELAGKATAAELGFDALQLLVERENGARYDALTAARGWRRSELHRNLECGVWALAMEFARRGITRDVRENSE